jgi:hypothetical protein
VGKIGTNSPTYIQPVSERADGIKSFFQKQQPSPAKAKPSVKDGTVKKEKIEEEDEEEIKAEVNPVKGEGLQAEERKSEIGDGIKSELPDGDEEKGLGDDSNAPNPEPNPDIKPSLKSEIGVKDVPVVGKRKRIEEDVVEDGKPERKGGQQTRVIRRALSEEGNKEVCVCSAFGVGHADGWESNLQSPISSKLLIVRNQRLRRRRRRGHERGGESDKTDGEISVDVLGSLYITLYLLYGLWYEQTMTSTTSEVLYLVLS